jgi:hypothetical protein
MMPAGPRVLTLVCALLAGELVYRSADAELARGYRRGFADGLEQGRELEHLDQLVDPDGTRAHG